MCDHTCKENQTAGPVASALYIHVPFCRRKCRYCDFYSVPVNEAVCEAFVSAAAREFERRHDRLASPLRSVYVGGGTPTALPLDLLERLLGLTGELVGESTEFTVEANPQTVSEELARVLADAGVNRVSVGAQSFNERELRLLGRIHGPDDIGRACENVRRAGIENINLDLIYGIPLQGLSEWSRTLEAALGMAPQHLSCYALSFAPGTPLEADLRAGRVSEAEDSVQRRQYEAARAAAVQAGLNQYELSNFARDGRECVHNITYWKNRPYAGIGPAAASYIDTVRSTNTPGLENYVRSLLCGEDPPASTERLRGRTRAAEAVMLALRMTQGIDRDEFKSTYGLDVVEGFPRTVSRYCADGYLLVTPQRIRLAPRAYFVADTILADFLGEV
ncbi:MAG: radical SAM family heme chaperone HemW [Phycisphaerae bacterium]